MNRIEIKTLLEKQEKVTQLEQDLYDSNTSLADKDDLIQELQVTIKYLELELIKVKLISDLKPHIHKDK